MCHSYLTSLLSITLFKLNKMHSYIFDKIDLYCLYIFYFSLIVQRKDSIQNPHTMELAKPRAILILDPRIALLKSQILMAPLLLERYLVYTFFSPSLPYLI